MPELTSGKFDDYAKEATYELAAFGAGCFWGTEKYFAKDFTK